MDDSLKSSDPNVINTESTTQVKEQNVVKPIPKRASDEKIMLWESSRNDASVVKVLLSASTSNQPVIPVLNPRNLVRMQTQSRLCRRQCPSKTICLVTPKVWCQD